VTVPDGALAFGIVNLAAGLLIGAATGWAGHGAWTRWTARRTARRELAVVRALAHQPALTAAQIATAARLRRPVADRLLGELRTRGWVAVVWDDDGRSLYRATGRGDAAAGRGRRAYPTALTEHPAAEEASR